MRRLIAGSTLLLLIAAAGCKRTERSRVQATEEEPPQLASAVHMADTKTASQLIKGFYPLEQNAWRWTAGRFSVRLRTPLAAAQKGATLDLRFSAPEPIVQKLNKIVISATVNGTSVPPETYSKAGTFAYTREVPASAFSGGSDAATVEFALEKALAPSTADARELGVVVSSVSLQAK